MIWRVCERFGILPPGITHDYCELTPWLQAQLLAYEQVRGYEELEIASMGLVKKT